MLYPSRHRCHLLPSAQKLPFARNSARDIGQTLCLSSNFSIIGQQLGLCLLFGLLRSPFLLLPWNSWYTFFGPSHVLQKLFQHYSEEEKTWSPFSSIKSYLSQRAAVRIRPKTFLASAQPFSLGKHFIIGAPLGRERWGKGSITQQKKPGLS